MIGQTVRSQVPAGSVGIVMREFDARLLNFSPSGCLIETTAPVAVGTTGALGFAIGGEDVADDVQVVRCDLVPGAGSVYHVAARFLWTAPPVRGTLRALFWDRQ